MVQNGGFLSSTGLDVKRGQQRLLVHFRVLLELLKTDITHNGSEHFQIDLAGVAYSVMAATPLCSPVLFIAGMLVEDEQVASQLRYDEAEIELA
jgi:hypothetical protein